MKEILFKIIVLILMPIYVIIKLTKKTIKMLLDWGQPFIDVINCFVDNMCKYWEKVFKIKEEK